MISAIIVVLQDRGMIIFLYLGKKPIMNPNAIWKHPQKPLSFVYYTSFTILRLLRLQSTLYSSDPLSHRTSCKDGVKTFGQKERGREDNKEFNGTENCTFWIHLTNLYFLFSSWREQMSISLFAFHFILLLPMVFFHAALLSVENTVSRIQVNIRLNLCSQDSKDQW